MSVTNNIYNDEQRKHTRINLNREVIVTLTDGSVFIGVTSNISFGGIQFDCKQMNARLMGKDCQVEIKLQSEPMLIEIVISSQILWVKNNFAGIRFISISVENYNHFQHLMVFNSPDPEALMEEVERNPGLLVLSV